MGYRRSSLSNCPFFAVSASFVCSLQFALVVLWHRVPDSVIVAPSGSKTKAGQQVGAKNLSPEDPRSTAPAEMAG